MAVNEEREQKLCDLFNEYGKSKSFALSKMNDSNFKNLSEDERKVPQRVRLIYELVHRVKKRINSMDLGKKIHLTPTFSFNIKESADFPLKIASMMTGNGASEKHMFFVNIKATDLLNMTPENLYSLLTYSIFSHVLSHDTIEGRKNKAETFLEEHQSYESGLESLQTEEEKVKFQRKQKKARLVLKIYLESYFEKEIGRRGHILAEKFSDLGPIADIVACEMIQDLDEKQLDELMNQMFTKEFIDNAFREAFDFVITSDIVYDSRITRLGELSIEKFKAGPESLEEALNYKQQHDALLNQRTRGSFNKMKASGVDEKGNLKPNKELENFCTEYINSFMSSNGLRPIRITFYSVDEQGKALELGTFFDSENPRINVNLAKINSATELAMTLSHELAHAVDSTKNKVKVGSGERIRGVTMSRGLADYIGDDVDDAKKKLGNNYEAIALLEKVNKLCYIVSPNERNARVMELSALKFMQSVTTDSFDRKEIEVSAHAFIAYQQKTIDAIKELREGGFEKLANDIKALNISDSAVVVAFTERLEYLRRFLDKEFERNLDIDFEEKSIEDAQAFIGGGAQEKAPETPKDKKGKELSPEEIAELAAQEAMQRQ